MKKQYLLIFICIIFILSSVGCSSSVNNSSSKETEATSRNEQNESTDYSLIREVSKEELEKIEDKFIKVASSKNASIEKIQKGIGEEDLNTLVYVTPKKYKSIDELCAMTVKE